MIDHGPTHGPPPRDYLQSVDLALTLILLLRDRGEISVSGAAHTLGVPASTIHRSLAMLVYRGFALRTADRTYESGPALSSFGLEPGVSTELIKHSQSSLESIARTSGETAQLMVLSGNKCNIVTSVEASGTTHVSARRGQIVPAEKNAGGLAMLAELSVSELRSLYPKMPDEEFQELRRTLRRSRDRGFAINNGLYEPSVSAVGAALISDVGDVLGAIAVTVPTHKFRQVYRRCTDVLISHVRDLNRTFRPLHTPASSAFEG